MELEAMAMVAAAWQGAGKVGGGGTGRGNKD
jgi:hypothetical protein